MDTITDLQVNLFIVFVGVYVPVIGVWTAYSDYLGALAEFPGPKLVAETLWYEFYYDVILLLHWIALEIGAAYTHPCGLHTSNNKYHHFMLSVVVGIA